MWWKFMSFHNNATLTLVFQICEKEYLRDLIPLTANSLYEVQTTIDSFLLLFELNPLSNCIDVLPVLFNTLLELPFLSARTFLFTASLADCLLLEGVCPHIDTKKDTIIHWQGVFIGKSVLQVASVYVYQSRLNQFFSW